MIENITGLRLDKLHRILIRACQRRFHPRRTFKGIGNQLLVRLRDGGLQEMPDHLLTWGGDTRIDQPDKAHAVIHVRVLLSLGFV
jgi:predicted DNA-binding transcriptional regulator YafY